MSSSPLLVARSTQGKIVLTGSDRASFLHGLLTNDIASLTAGTGTYAAYLTPQGRMISDMRVLETGDRILLDVEAAVVNQLAEKLEQLIFAEDVVVQNVTASLAEFGIHGPSAAGLLERVTGKDLSTLARQYDNARFVIADAEATIVRDDALGLPGFDIYVAVVDADRVRAALLEAGAVRSGCSDGRGASDRGGPSAFRRRHEHRNDSSRGRHRGSCHQLYEGLLCRAGSHHPRHASRPRPCGSPSGAPDPARWPGAVARGQDLSRRSTGRRESRARRESPKAGAPLAMGYVHRDHTAPGTELIVERLKGGRVSARLISSASAGGNSRERELVARDPAQLLSEQRPAALR